MNTQSKWIPAAGVVLVLFGIASHFSVPLIPGTGGGVESTEAIAAVVIVYESADNTVAQAKTEAAIHAFCKVHSLAYRLVDQNDVDQSGQTPADEAAWIAKAAGKTLPQWLLIGPKGGLVSQAGLPKTDVEATAALLKHTGGN